MKLAAIHGQLDTLVLNFRELLAHKGHGKHFGWNNAEKLVPAYKVEPIERAQALVPLLGNCRQGAISATYVYELNLREVSTPAGLSACKSRASVGLTVLLAKSISFSDSATPRKFKTGSEQLVLPAHGHAPEQLEPLSNTSKKSKNR